MDPVKSRKRHRSAQSLAEVVTASPSEETSEQVTGFLVSVGSDKIFHFSLTVTKFLSIVMELNEET